MVAFHVLNAGYQSIVAGATNVVCPGCYCDCGCQCSCECFCICPCDCDNYSSLYTTDEMPTLDTTYKGARDRQNNGDRSGSINGASSANIV
jgi:hypothetical protein